MILGLDTSHFQGAPNMGAVRSVGRDFIVLKATEGTTYADPTMAANRKAAHAAGLIVGLYHFARAGNAAAEAAWFLKTVGTLQPGEFLVLDQEVSSTVAWCKTWLDTVAKATGVNPLIYMNKGAATGLGMGDWSSVASTYGLWLATYDNAPATQNAVPYWGVPAMKQYSDAGSVLGVAGTCDVDSFFGSRDQLLAYGKQDSSNGAVDMTPDEHNMLARIFTELTQQLPSRAYPSAPGTDTLAGYAVNTDGFGWRLENKVLPAVVEQVQALATQVGQVAAPQLDEAKLAAALLADPASVDRLGAAIAAHLKLTSG